MSSIPLLPPLRALFLSIASKTAASNAHTSCLSSLKVLSQVGFADFVTNSAPHLARFCDRASHGLDLGLSSLPLCFEEKYGFPGCGVNRTALNLALKEALAVAGIPVHEGWRLKKVIEKDDSVVAFSEDGREATGIFMVGCDGIKAVSRSLVLKEHGLGEAVADYTHLVQVSFWMSVVRWRISDFLYRLPGCLPLPLRWQIVRQCLTSTDRAHTSFVILSLQRPFRGQLLKEM